MTGEPEPARGEDVPALVLLDRLSRASGWSEAQFQAEVSKNPSTTYVLRRGGVVGFITLWSVGEERQIANVAVDAAWRRQGLGRLLWNVAASHPETRLITLEVREGNVAARAFYESVGCRVVGRRPRFYDGVEDAILMERRIPDFLTRE